MCIKTQSRQPQMPQAIDTCQPRKGTSSDESTLTLKTLGRVSRSPKWRLMLTSQNGPWSNKKTLKEAAKNSVLKIPTVHLREKRS